MFVAFSEYPNYIAFCLYAQVSEFKKAFAPLYIPKSFSNVSSRLIRLYRYESRRGDSTRGVDILLCIMWTGVAEDSREPVVELAKLTEFDFWEF